MDQFKKPYDLEERTAKFSLEVIMLCKQVKQGPITTPLINQLVRSGTSIGANYVEANGASSRKDFKNKIHICKKEAQETKYWLQLLGNSVLGNMTDIKKLWKEANELSMIFGKIVGTMSEKK